MGRHCYWINIQNTIFSKNPRILLVHFLLPFSFPFPFPRPRVGTRNAGPPHWPGSRRRLRHRTLAAIPVVLVLVALLTFLLLVILHFLPLLLLIDLTILLLLHALTSLILPCITGLLAIPAHTKTYDHPLILPQVLVLSHLLVLVLVPYRISLRVGTRRGAP